MTTSPFARQKSQHWANKTTVDYKFKTKIGSLFPTLISQAGSTNTSTLCFLQLSICIHLQPEYFSFDSSVWLNTFTVIGGFKTAFKLLKTHKLHPSTVESKKKIYKLFKIEI